MATKKVNKETKPKKRYATHITTAKGERVYVSAKTQEELDKKVSQLKLEMGVGVDISDNTLFNDYAIIWLNTYKKPPRIRQNSYDTIKYHLEKYVAPCFKGRKLKEIKPIHIQNFLSEIAGYSFSVQSKCLQLVRSVFLSAEDNGLIYKSPVRSCDKPGGKRPREKEALTNEQAQRLLESVKGSRAYLFCLLVLSTGLRRGEAIGLMWEDIDFDTGYINVTHNKALLPHGNDAPVTDILKSEAGRRRIPMPLLLRYVLEEEKKESKSPFVLSMKNGESFTKGAFDAMWRTVELRIADEKHPLGTVRGSNCGGKFTVCLDFHVHPHLLRHTYITQLFESGLDLKQVQYLAGHSTPDMTLSVYTHYRQKQREKETTEKVIAATSYLGEVKELPKASGEVIPFPAKLKAK